MDKIVVATEHGVLPNPENLLEQILVTEQEVVVVNTDTTGVVVTGIMGPPGASGSITGASDIAIWRATNRLDNQILEAGQF